jgi:mannose-1-phosphate guanylyltransferase/mannose-1-phosphate guanylyltransferase/mannose-6-phosphate isomerase
MGQRRIHPVVLCGGSGTRLWPLSRALYPKQLLALASERTLLQETILRAADAERFAAPVVVGNEEHRFILAEQLRELGVEPEALIVEPVGRNTAPAAAVAALLLSRDRPDAHMLVMPADHVIGDLDAFHDAVAVALRASEAGHLVTFGITPTRPHAGYGYIQRGEALPALPRCHAVARFVEKPDAATAAAWVASGAYLWNSGIFLFPAARYLAELERHEPAIVAAARQALGGAEHDLSFLRLDAEAFATSPANSIDYAVMERVGDAVVVPVDMGWSDVGSWAALWAVSGKDAAGNATHGDVIAVDVADSFLRSDGPAIAAVGLRDVVLVATKDAVLAVHRDRTEDVREIVERLRSEGRVEHISHRVVYRPWGSYETTDQGPGFRVKRLVVSPGQKLSLQMHHHRAEHWVVVQGTALVERDGQTIVLGENESTYISSGTPHRLENPGLIPLHLVEVQTGTYLEEDDIVRLDDDYGRPTRDSVSGRGGGRK